MEGMVSVEIPKEIALKLRDECHKGNHPWKGVHIDSRPFGEDIVVRWCPTCGSVTVDVYVDNRIMHPGGVMKIQSAFVASRMSWDGKG